MEKNTIRYNTIKFMGWDKIYGKEYNTIKFMGWDKIYGKEYNI